MSYNCNKKYFIYSTIILILLFITGCNNNDSFSDNSSNTSDISNPTIVDYKAQLVDSNIAGISYTSGTKSGITDQNGTFDYEKDHNVTFRLKNILIGSIDTSNINTNDKKVYIPEIFGKSRTDTNDTRIIKTLQLLQSLDSDNDPSNGIDINETTLAHIFGPEITIADLNLTNITSNVFNIPLINEEDALLHYESTLFKNNISSSRSYTAKLIGPNIQGISFFGDINGITDLNGTFTYEYGNNIVFKIGELKIGEISSIDINTTDKKVFLSEILNLDRNNSTDSKLVNIIRLINSLDQDQNNSNGITIDQNTTNILKDYNFDFSELTILEGQFNDIINATNNTLLKKVDALGVYESMLRENGFPEIDTIQTKSAILMKNIKGISYANTNDEVKGTTDTSGTFKYKTNDTVTFKIGSITLGQISTNDINDSNATLFISDLINIDRNDTTNQLLLNTLRMLQSLDSDNNASNGFDINDTSTLTEDINLRNISEINTTVDGAGKTLVSQLSVKEELETLMRENGYPDLDTIAPSIPQLYSDTKGDPHTSNSVTLIITGEINASIFLDGEDQEIDINSSGYGTINIENLIYNDANSFKISLVDSNLNQSSYFEFNITREDIRDPNVLKIIEIGYIKDANLTGYIYTDDNNSYTKNQTTFIRSFVTNPQTIVKDLNLSLSINLSTKTGTVLSPITTLVNMDLDTKLSLSRILGVSEDLSSFSIDYIKNNMLNYAKLSQSIWILLQDSNLSSSFIEILESNDRPLTQEDFNNKLIKNIDSNSSFNLIENTYSKRIIKYLNDYNSSVESMAIAFKDLRYSFDNNFSLHRKYQFKSNQTICFDKTDSSTTIDCSDENAMGDATSTFGDDYTDERDEQDDYNNTIKITSSNIIWTDNNETNLTKNFISAKDYCLNLNINGINTWKLPSINDLILLMDRNSTSTSNILRSTFNSPAPILYWSNTPYLSDPNYYFVANFENGFSEIAVINQVLSVRCIAINNELNKSIIIDSTPIREDINNTVIDTSTMLQWHDDVNITKTWVEANTYCQNSNLSGFTDWKLPNINQLYLLADKKESQPSINIEYKNTVSKEYWSSTTNINTPAEAFTVDFQDGFIKSSLKDDNANNVRCVRQW